MEYYKYFVYDHKLFNSVFPACCTENQSPKLLQCTAVEVLNYGRNVVKIYFYQFICQLLIFSDLLPVYLIIVKAN